MKILCRYLVLAVNIYISNAFLFPNMLPFYYQIGRVEDLKDKPIKIVIDNNHLCLFKDLKTKQIKLVDDKCAHRYASLSKGELDKNSGIICGYHGITFHKGSKPDLTNHLKIVDGSIFFCPTEDSMEEPYYPPEHFNKKYRLIKGTKKINTNVLIFLSNVIDCLHVSHVHKFGTKGQLPVNLNYKRLSLNSFRQSFEYKAGAMSLSKQIQKIKKEDNFLKVQNEYNLPADVLSRVAVDPQNIKTVFIRAFPINDKETIIYWYLYRNFLVFDCELLNILSDHLFNILFKFTLSEDIELLNHVYIEDTTKQFNTKYDKIQIEFRKDYDTNMNNMNNDFSKNMDDISCNTCKTCAK